MELKTTAGWRKEVRLQRYERGEQVPYECLWDAIDDIETLLERVKKLEKIEKAARDVCEFLKIEYRVEGGMIGYQKNLVSQFDLLTSLKQALAGEEK